MSSKETKSDRNTDIRKHFENKLSVYEALREEAVFIANSIVKDQSIKIHQIESRVKDFKSLTRKMETGSYDSIDEINDIVGIRIVCLFKSDLEKIRGLFDSCFDIIEIDDKIESSQDSFGYMSIHFICKMKSNLLSYLL